MITVKCSECGKEIRILSCRDWSYRIKLYENRSRRCKFPKDSLNRSSAYQCSYTCYDHAMLRVTKKRGYLTRENFIKYVQKSEEKIMSDGRSVRFPINVSNFKEK